MRKDSSAFGLRMTKQGNAFPSFVILSANEESFFFAQMRISGDRHPEERSGAAIRFFCITHLLQICGFAGLFIVLSYISGTPLSSLVGRKLQRSTRRRGEKNLPALRSTPLRAEGLLFRSSHAAQDADLPALLMKCFVLETWVLSPMKRKKDSSAFGLRMTEERQCMSFSCHSECK